jgi:L-fuconate dehydratase
MIAAVSASSRVERIEVHDLRFPTSSTLAGSDAMNPDPDYSCVYVILTTTDGQRGHGYTFTIGRGNEIVALAVRSLGSLIAARPVDELVGDLGATARRVSGDSQLRWIGPEKGAIHLAAAAIMNALWDLRGRLDAKPVWQVLADMAPAEIVGLVDFRHLSDALDPGRARELLEERASMRSAIADRLRADGLPAYITSAGWLGYSRAQVVEACELELAGGWTRFKMKVGRDLDDDVGRLTAVREILGSDVRVGIDANQVWEVGQAIEWVRRLAPFDPWWIEEPTSPDDVLGHAAIARGIAPIRVATGEMCHNRVMFKQFLAAGAMAVCQLDPCRLAGVNEAVAVSLLAALHGVPVCPHAGGVGLCEVAQHVAAFDAIAVAADHPERACEYAGHLHEWFVDPVRTRSGAYVLPERPGFSTELRPEAIDTFAFPGGGHWAGSA